MADTSTDNITQVRIDIGELKGILNTTVVTQSEDIRDLKKDQAQLRYDLDKVKDNGTAALNTTAAAMVDKINQVAVVANTNTTNIAELRVDVNKVEEKQNATFGKVLQVLSPIFAGLALVWAVLGGRT